MPRHIGLALRIALALDAGVPDGCNAVVDEIRGDDDALELALNVACAAASMFTRSAYELGLRSGHPAEAWLNVLALGFLDGIQAQLGGEG
jgi:hypothetical protein